MNERNKLPDLLWMFRNNATQGGIGEIEYDPADPIYQLYHQTRNPYLKRAIAPSARKLDRSAEDLAQLFRFINEQNRYEVAPSNVRLPQERRTMPHAAPPATTNPSYVIPKQLSGDPKKLPWMIDIFFRSILSQLRYDPGDFKEVVEDLMVQFQDDGMQIKLYEAYHTFSDWDDLMNTLEEIGRYPSPETFDLFCSALLVYYKLAYPESAP